MLCFSRTGGGLLVSWMSHGARSRQVVSQEVLRQKVSIAMVPFTILFYCATRRGGEEEQDSGDLGEGNYVGNI